MSDERRILTAESVAMLKAADYIDEHGWCQGMGESATGAVCAGYAILKSGGLIGSAYNRFSRYLYTTYGVAGIWRWNDTPRRTKEQVIGALRGAAFLFHKDRS